MCVCVCLPALCRRHFDKKNKQRASVIQSVDEKRARESERERERGKGEKEGSAVAGTLQA